MQRFFRHFSSTYKKQGKQAKNLLKSKNYTSKNFFLKKSKKSVAKIVRLIEEREAEKICLFYSVSLLFSAENAGL